MNKTELLKTFLEKGFINKKDKLQGLLLPSLNLAKNAEKIYKEINRGDASGNVINISISPEIYNGNNQTAGKISGIFEGLQASSVVKVLVHGSIASCDEIPYSDFDGLIIIDPHKFSNSKDLLMVRKAISASEQVMYQMDALQHHGWKILLSDELNNYPDAAFPLHLLQEGKVIYANNHEPVQIYLDKNKQDYQYPFQHLTRSIIRKCHKPPQDLYEFKILCSEIMLLPAIFLQAIYHKPVSKKISFSQMEKEFTGIDQDIIIQVSQWRQEWKQEPVNRKTLLFHKLRQSGIYASRLAPAIPRQLTQQLTVSWYQKVIELCVRTGEEINIRKQPAAEGN